MESSHTVPLQLADGIVAVAGLKNTAFRLISPFITGLLLYGLEVG
jgi:hypothetical protein